MRQLLLRTGVGVWHIIKLDWPLWLHMYVALITDSIRINKFPVFSTLSLNLKAAIYTFSHRELCHLKT